MREDYAARSRHGFRRRLGDAWNTIVYPRRAATDERVAEAARAIAPVVWLIGKVQSGKSSIVRVLTGSTEAEVGSGFKACTRTSRIFDYPAEAPVIRFLDTRGLGEAGYDPSEDIAFCEGRAQLLLVVMKALDHDQDAILALVRQQRQQHPTWPVVVAQTCLHEGYPPGARHPPPADFDAAPGAANAAPGLPPDLTRSLALQRKLFASIPGSGPIVFVPLDFTHEADGYDPVNYGLETLLEALQWTAPAGLVAALHDAHNRALSETARQAHPHVLGYAMAAAAADVVPVAGVVAVPSVQAKMLHSLARIYGVAWNRRAYGEFAAALGVGTLLRGASMFGLRELAKLVPVYGQTAGAAAAAAASFATTYALGKAACLYLGMRRRGSVEQSKVIAAYRAALSEAFRMASEGRMFKSAGKEQT